MSRGRPPHNNNRPTRQFATVADNAHASEPTACPTRLFPCNGKRLRSKCEGRGEAVRFFREGQVTSPRRTRARVFDTRH